MESENVNMIVYTLVVVLLFVLFGIGTFLEFKKMHKNEYTGNERSDDQALVSRFFAKLFG